MPIVPRPELYHPFEEIATAYNRHAQGSIGRLFSEYIKTVVIDPKLLADLLAFDEYQQTLEPKLRKALDRENKNKG